MRKFNEKDIEMSYKYSPIAEGVRNALNVPLKRYSVLLKNYICIVDDETKDVIYLFPASDLNKAGKDLKAIVISDIKNNLKKSGIQIAEEKATFNDFYRVGFLSQMFRFSCT